MQAFPLRVQRGRLVLLVSRDPGVQTDAHLLLPLGLDQRGDQRTASHRPQCAPPRSSRTSSLSACLPASGSSSTRLGSPRRKATGRERPLVASSVRGRARPCCGGGTQRLPSLLPQPRLQACRSLQTRASPLDLFPRHPPPPTLRRGCGAGGRAGRAPRQEEQEENSDRPTEREAAMLAGGWKIVRACLRSRLYDSRLEK